MKLEPVDLNSDASSEARCDTRQRIISAATEAMIAKSYNGTGLNEILQSAGVPKGSFYHFFKSKENLGIAVIEKAAADHLEELRLYFTDRNRTPRERIAQYLKFLKSEALRKEVRQQCVVCKLALEQSDMSGPMKAAIRCSQDQALSSFAQVIREAQAAGEVNPSHDPDQLADFFKSALSGAMIRVQVEEDIKPLESFEYFVVNVLLR